MFAFLKWRFQDLWLELIKQQASKIKANVMFLRKLDEDDNVLKFICNG